MGSVYNGIPEEFALGIKKTNGLNCFIETGTCHGTTSAWAAEMFDKVFTIELSHELAQIAGKNLNKYPNVTLMEGDSSVRLKEILNQIDDSPCMFWLDAHFSGDITSGENKNAPVFEELALIMKCRGTHCILIDDARFFVAPLSLNPNEYPGLAYLYSIVDFKRYSLYIVDDVLVLLPANNANNTYVHSYVWKQDFLRSRRTFSFYWRALINRNFKGFLVGLLLWLKLYKYKDKSCDLYFEKK